MNYLTVGDVEKVSDNEIFIRLWFDEQQREELNKKLNAEFSNTEWVTMVVDSQLKNVSKIVAYCEAQNKEYDLSAIFTKGDVNYYINEAFRFYLKTYLTKRLEICEKDKERNLQANKGLGGFIATEQGRIRESYLKGKIEIIKAVLERLED